MRYNNPNFWLVIIAFTISGVGGVSAAPDIKSLTIEDYAKVRQVSELALSSDGQLIVYTVETPADVSSRYGRSVILQRAEANALPIDVTFLQDARRFAWIPSTHELAYIAANDDGHQIYATDIETQKTRRLTSGSERPLSFKFSNDGKKMALITQSVSRDESNQASLYDRLHKGDTGVVIDHRTARLTHFINPNFREGGSWPTRSLLVMDGNDNPIKATIPGDVTGFEWSSNGEKLSVRYLADVDPADPFAALYTSIGVFDIASRKFSALGVAVPTGQVAEAVYYLGGEWAAGDEEIFVRRVRPSSFWRSRRDWRNVSIDTNEISPSDDAGWNEVKIYPASEAFVQLDDATTVVNGISKAQRLLLEVDPEGPRTMPIGENTQGDIGFVQFSSDRSVVAFVNQSLVRAPEVFVSRDGETKQISNINLYVNSKQMPDARVVNWRGEDGVQVQGWLLMPPSMLAVGVQDNKQPLPMLTFLHGGPSIPMTNSFAQYYTLYGGIWPYPLEVLALNGIAVFIPNYRGTDSFGDDYSNPDRSDGAAVTDVILGIKSLVAAGIADEATLGIVGHSHGAWLGALVMTRMKNFVASSFGEGPQNNMLTYIFSPGYLYEEGYHKLWGAGLYQSPQRYLETSPVFYFAGLRTATLFEAGVESQALSMMGSPKAAHLAGMPTEFVVYPKTGHNIREPKLKNEVAHRNLDWFLFWMLGREDGDQAKAAQYSRWREMRNDSCGSRDQVDAMASYCNFLPN